RCGGRRRRRRSHGGDELAFAGFFHRRFRRRGGRLRFFGPLDKSVRAPAFQFGNRRAAGDFFSARRDGRDGFAVDHQLERRVFFAQLADDLVVLLRDLLGGGKFTVGIGELGNDLIVFAAQIFHLRLRLGEGA